MSETRRRKTMPPEGDAKDRDVTRSQHAARIVTKGHCGGGRLSFTQTWSVTLVVCLCIGEKKRTIHSTLFLQTYSLRVLAEPRHGPSLETRAETGIRRHVCSAALNDQKLTWSWSCRHRCHQSCWCCCCCRRCCRCCCCCRRCHP